MLKIKRTRPSKRKKIKIFSKRSNRLLLWDSWDCCSFFAKDTI